MAEFAAYSQVIETGHRQWFQKLATDIEAAISSRLPLGKKKFSRFWAMASWAPFFDNVMCYTTPCVYEAIVKTAWEDPYTAIGKGFCTKHFTKADHAYAQKQIRMALAHIIQFNEFLLLDRNSLAFPDLQILWEIIVKLFEFVLVLKVRVKQGHLLAVLFISVQLLWSVSIFLLGLLGILAMN
ncbi:unknown protein [Seminavis robusta]|uniref:Uncharacterized protein n=1 Tax=Seminavis robusta TaxID=568900 RepID=A0A9N8E5Q4_9STRA|nr:unknown protein [Seminavis robusta]|eukprot:Sro699_g189410.1 n/a (183) ;mRNA; r:15564-16112